MEFKIEDISLFKAIFRSITKFTDVARFDINSKGIRLRSIDPHDFCYLDIRLTPSFFSGFSWESETFSSEAEIGKLRQVISKITKEKTVYLDIKKKNIALTFTNNSKTSYELEWLDEEQFNLPEPQDLEYDAYVTLPANEFLEIVNEASSVSREIFFGVENGKFVVGSQDGGFSYSKKIDLSGQVFDSSKNKIPKKTVKSWTILDYLRTISEIVSQCGEVRLGLSEELPLRVELSYRGRGSFIFIVSNQALNSSETSAKKIRLHKKNNPMTHSATAIPQISVTKFPKFLESIKDGIPQKNLLHSRYETENGDYFRLGELLGFISSSRGVVTLSKEGETFVGSLENRSTKPKLNKKLIDTIPEYGQILKLLSSGPQNSDDIIDNLKKSKNSVIKNKDDVLLLLGLATWCNAIDRKLGLFYFSK